MNIKRMMLNERSQTKMCKYRMILFIQNSRKCKLIYVTESELWFPGDKGGMGDEAKRTDYKGP